ncbi:hypothetical protein AB0H58_16640 [Nocardia neocaledoniensis]|uniref:Uncharacterized protein n=1 Tax=Nocardia neocaledoniensis TaxID=236511 RepID=A0A317NV28_9NOCA|nr:MULTISPECIES: hypothetical protein [Nocardia]PWV79149.1 hypothetical protein DFR69_102211 [Nocardia neocaledoniensis]UGT57238.1 hypothetical protein LTT85_10520 [Nocardia asteroides]
MKLRKTVDLRKSVNLRKSTAILMATWVSTFVVYVFVKPTEAKDAGPVSLLNAVPTWVNPAP